MYEIKVADLATDSPEFGGVKRAALDRYDRLYKQHVSGWAAALQARCVTTRDRRGHVHGDCLDPRTGCG